jgi:predicted nucleotide-binding protein
MATTDREKIDNAFERLMVQYRTAITASTMQDAATAENAFREATVIYSGIEKFDMPDEKSFMSWVVSFIELLSSYSKANYLFLEERFKKSKEEFDKALAVVVKLKEKQKIINQEFVTKQELEKLYGLINFFISYFEHMANIMSDIAMQSQQMIDGKYIDEVKFNQNAAREIRNFDYKKYTTDDDDFNSEIINIVGMLGRIADVYDNKAEKAEEKIKTIEFLKPIDKNVFLVHGHEEGNLRELKDLLKDNFNITPIILRDEQDGGKTIIEKLEDYGRKCAFAFVLITPDDVVENKKTKLFQARPNVLFELGWFCGRFGRSKVRMLRKNETPLPSDLHGLIAYEFKDKVSEVFLNIKKDLEAAGII